MVITTEFLRELDRFSIVLKKKVNSEYAGSRQSLHGGSGLVFRDFRSYAPGDDFRNIDWRVYARTEKLFLKRYEEERNLAVHILVDASGSMNFGSPTSKYEYAAQIGLGFGYMALKNNEKFSFASFSEKAHPIKAHKGMNQLFSILEHLNRHKPHGVSKFKESMAQYKKYVKSRSLVLIVSDFLVDVNEIQQALTEFKRSELILVQVLDPIEWRFSLDGDFLLQDAETESSLKTLVTQRLREDYRQKLTEHLAKIKSMAEALGAIYLGVTTDAPIFNSFYRVLTAQKKNKK